MEIKKTDNTVLYVGEGDIRVVLVAAVREGVNLRGANLRGADLREANLERADLWGANLREANLRGVNLREANLERANLWGADLRGANLRGANLREADLEGANLWGANLERANLEGANLWEANLWEANLRGANLCGAKYNINQLFNASWAEVSPELCAYLMRFDAESIPNGMRLMEEWAGGSSCPLCRTNGIGRVIYFCEKRENWNLVKTLPVITPWEIWKKLATEKNIKIC